MTRTGCPFLTGCLLSAAMLLAACSEPPTAPPAEGPAPLFPDVLDARAELDANGTWTFWVTLASPYDSPERYADAWRIVGPDGTEHGFRLLMHHHADEQPFTRYQTGIRIPADVRVVTIEGRDLKNGWGGATVELTLER